MRTEHVDVCVIGSGAGGAVVAHEAARSGRRTLVLERGPYVRPWEMTNHEADMIPRLYKDGGMQLNTGLDFFILQGSCVGGSTVVSNMVLMRPAAEVFERWAQEGASLDVAALERSYDAVEKTLGARLAEGAASRSTELFKKGARAIGAVPKPMLKALGDCKACGNCNIGCSFGAKRSALTTFVQWAEDAGARILASTPVERLRLRKGKVEHVEARLPSGEALRVVAKTVVLSAGAIGSSAILLASGLKGNVGRRLSFNVGAMMVGDFPEVVDSFDADQMTTFVQQDGYLIEATHNPLMSAALTTPGWFAEHGDLMRRSKHLAYAGAMVGSEPVGRVVHSRWMGHEETRFRATDRTIEVLREGLSTIARIFFAAGASRVLLPTEAFTALGSVDDLPLIERRVRTMRDLQCGSSHPQGGNPMSDDPSRGVVDTSLAVHGVNGLFVCDASVFPGSVDVNPMNTVLALAHHAAPRIVASA